MMHNANACEGREHKVAAAIEHSGQLHIHTD
jgi:hypothetical protein